MNRRGFLQRTAALLAGVVAAPALALELEQLTPPRRLTGTHEELHEALRRVWCGYGDTLHEELEASVGEWESFTSAPSSGAFDGIRTTPRHMIRWDEPAYRVEMET